MTPLETITTAESAGQSEAIIQPADLQEFMRCLHSSARHWNHLEYKPGLGYRVRWYRTGDGQGVLV